MKPGSSDGIMTVLASVLVTALLFFAQYVTSAPGNNRSTSPEDRLGGASAGTQRETDWSKSSTEFGSANAPAAEDPDDPFDTPFSPPQDVASNSSPRSRLPSIPAASGTKTSSRPSSPTGETTSRQTRTFDSVSTDRSNSDSRRSEGSDDERSTAAAPASYKVVRIIDGDTVDLLVNRQPVRLRLNGIDTPEKGQPFGNTAKDVLSKAIGGQYVQYVVRDTDRYNRSIADLYFRGVHINKWLVQNGLAWHYKAYNNDPVLSQAEQQAQAAQRGLWADPRRVAPWNWRKLSKVERDHYR